MERQQVFALVADAQVGTEQHSLKMAALDNARQFDFCPKCKKLVHASLVCSCNTAAITITANRNIVSAMTAALSGQRVW